MNYLAIAIIAAVAIILAMLYLKDRRIKKLEMDLSNSMLDAVLKEAKEKSNESEEKYLAAKSDYDKYKSDHPELFR